MCTDAISLANTGRVRLAIDDILLDSTVGPQPVTCKYNGAGVNLTAINATLLPSEQLVCSFNAVTDQAAFEAGHVNFSVSAVGVAAYGTHPAIAGVLNGEVSGVVLLCW